jgi:hypothetical protein
MNTVEFEGTVTPNGQMVIPAEIHVVLQGDRATDEDGAWRSEGRQRFEAAYAPEDAIYDQLMDR